LDAGSRKVDVMAELVILGIGLFLAVLFFIVPEIGVWGFDWRKWYSLRD
jgi:hypothetical protein